MTTRKIADIVRDTEGRLVRNSFLEAISAAGDGDIQKLLMVIDVMSERGEAIPAENVAVLVRAAWMAKPPRGKGRPPKGIDERACRLVTGVEAIKRNQRGETVDEILENPTPGTRGRDKRDLERCMEEARNAFGAKLEGWDVDENSA